MKNKKTIYILLPLVALIWGLVVYRIFDNLKTPAYTPTNVDRSVIRKNDTTNTDSIMLVLQYRDPFKPAPVYTAPSNTPVKKEKTLSFPPGVNPFNWPDVRYSGMVKSKEKNEVTALVCINNKNYLMKTGEEIQYVKLIDVYQDSIKVSYCNAGRTIRRGGGQQNNPMPGMGFNR